MIKDLNLSISFLSENDISVLPQKKKPNLNSSDLSQCLFDELISPVGKKTGRSEDLGFFLDFTSRKTLREFDDVDENAKTLRNEPCLMCVNCAEYILIEEIDLHSRYCLTPLASTEAVYEKIHKLLGLIREQQTESQENGVLLVQLEEIARALYEQTIVIAKQTLPAVFAKLNSLEKSEPFISLIIQRLNKLAEALPENTQCKKSLKVEKITIDAIDSTLQVSEVHKNTFLSILSDISLDFAFKDEHKTSEESLEKYFYSQCVKKKMGLSPSSPLRHISIFSLFQECTEKKIPVEQWGNFINAAFNEQFMIIS